MGLFDRKKKKQSKEDEEIQTIDRKTATEIYNRQLDSSKEKVYWNTGVCWKCGQTMEPDSEYCWECGTKYKVRK